MKDETKHLIDEMKLAKQLDEIYKRNVRSFNNYFKYSGKIEQTKENFGPWVRRERKKYGCFLSTEQIKKDIRS